MASNGRKEFPKGITENDITYERKRYCYCKNAPQIVKYFKRKINRRFRKSNKKIAVTE